MVKTTVMFDNVGLEVKNFTIKEFNQFVENIGQSNNFNNKRGRKITYWQNLRFSYFENKQILKIENSLHKFYNAEIANFGLYNHDNFTYFKVEAVINLLQSKLKRGADEIFLKGIFEYGLNINTSIYRPFNDIIERYQSVVTTATNPFHAIFNKYGKPYLKFCAFNQYKVKVYDKGKEMGLPSKFKIMRYEIVHDSSVKTRKVFKKEIAKLEDLLDKDIWNKCFNHLLNSYDNIRILPFPNEVSVEEYSKCLLFASPTLKQDFKKEVKKNYKDLKSVHDSAKYAKNSIHSTIKDRMIENYEHLILN